MDDPGNLSYSEAVAAGLYGADHGESHVDAQGGLAADSVQGPAVEPRFGKSRHEPRIIPQAKRH